jgi:arsenate reductase
MVNTGKIRVLFLCTHNQARSQMAEGLLKAMGKERFEVFSAGTHPASQVHILAMRALEELGIDISQQKPKKLTEFLDQEFDYIITTCDRLLNTSLPEFTGEPQQLHWSIPDPLEIEGPTSEQFAEFCRIAAELKVRLKVITDLPAPEKKAN